MTPNSPEAAIRKKIDELIHRSNVLVPSAAFRRKYGVSSSATRDTRHIGSCQGWITEALNIVELAVPIENNSYRRQVKKIAEGVGNLNDHVASIASILRALLSDMDAGLIAVQTAIRAETFDDFLDHADAYRKKGQKQPAGVLAGVVFEDTIRRICRDSGVTEKDEDLEKLVHALLKQAVLTGQQGKQARVAAHVRTKATHAQWDQYDLNGVAETITLTRTLLRDHLRKIRFSKRLVFRCR